MRTVVASLALATTLATGACSKGGSKDLEGVTPRDPDKTILINNVDGFPNVSVICIEGIALTTTTRDDSGAALRHIVELDKLCPGYVEQRTPER